MLHTKNSPHLPGTKKAITKHSEHIQTGYRKLCNLQLKNMNYTLSAVLCGKSARKRFEGTLLFLARTRSFIAAYFGILTMRHCARMNNA
jgi:hypothetical protein